MRPAVASFRTGLGKGKSRWDAAGGFHARGRLGLGGLGRGARRASYNNQYEGPAVLYGGCLPPVHSQERELFLLLNAAGVLLVSAGQQK